MAWHEDVETIGGARFFVRDWRSAVAEGPPVLALHGSLTQSGMWLAPAEAAATVRMVCPDQRGFGRSDDPGTDACADFAADALALAQRRLSGRYVVMGHSFACSIALEVALRDAARIAGIVLVDPVVRVGTAAGPAAPPPSPPPENFATLDDAMTYWRETEEGVWPEPGLRRFVQDVMMRDGENTPWRFPYTAARLRRLRAFTASAASDFDLLAKARAVRGPVLVFRGGQSKRFPQAAEPILLDAFAERPELVLCPQSGHFPSATEPAIVVGALQRFLAGL